MCVVRFFFCEIGLSVAVVFRPYLVQKEESK